MFNSLSFKTIFCHLAIIIAVSCFAIGQVFAGNLQGNTVVLGALDKVTGRVSSIEIKVGETASFQALEINVVACFYKTPEEAPDNMVFLDITEILLKNKGKKDYFNGWMYSSSPALNALEHPVYDIWSISCKNIIDDNNLDN